MAQGIRRAGALRLGPVEAAMHLPPAVGGLKGRKAAVGISCALETKNSGRTTRRQFRRWCLAAQEGRDPNKIPTAALRPFWPLKGWWEVHSGLHWPQPQCPAPCVPWATSHPPNSPKRPPGLLSPGVHTRAVLVTGPWSAPTRHGHNLRSPRRPMVGPGGASWLDPNGPGCRLPTPLTP